jgi:hypothetical protein
MYDISGEGNGKFVRSILSPQTEAEYSSSLWKCYQHDDVECNVDDDYDGDNTVVRPITNTARVELMNPTHRCHHNIEAIHSQEWNPTEIVGHDGKLYVCDALHHCIHIFIVDSAHTTKQTSNCNLRSTILADLSR